MRVLMVGDVFGRPGREALHRNLPLLRVEHSPDMVIVNAENAAAGSGITKEIATAMLRDDGVDVITLGNHAWSKREVYPYLESEERIVRPANYAAGVPGHGWTVVTAGQDQVCVISLLGRVYMDHVADPFDTADQILNLLPSTVNFVVVDFHAEATAEKAALAYHLDGRVSAIIGTHTHVQTADERIFPRGTAFISDVGMTGPRDSIIGVKVEPALARFRTQMPQRFEPAEGPSQLCAVLIHLEQNLAKSIERIQVYPA